MVKLKILASFIILILALSCSRITHLVERKVVEKVNKTIDENMKKMDSTFSKEKLDSLKSLLDSISNANSKDNKRAK